MKPARLHVFPLSPNSRKVMILNEHLGLGLPIQMVDLRTGDQKAAAFIALNPNGKVPVLEFDDGSTLWESNVILNRLAGIAKSDLWPASEQRYDIMRWQFWEAAHWTPACTPFILRHVFGDESVDLAAAETEFRRFATVLDDHLAGRDWLSGDTLTTADMSVAPIMCLRAMCHFPMAGFANIEAWAARFEALEANRAMDRALEAA